MSIQYCEENICHRCCKRGALGSPPLVESGGGGGSIFMISPSPGSRTRYANNFTKHCHRQAILNKLFAAAKRLKHDVGHGVRPVILQSFPFAHSVAEMYYWMRALLSSETGQRGFAWSFK
jgi:hypothetical protein